MKFAHAFQERLQNDGYPPEWVTAAISYRQLKKCIKKVERELDRLGLDVETLGQVLRTAEQERDERHAQYLLLNPDADASCAALFEPKLLIAVDEATGEPLDAHLSPTTRDYLQQLSLSQPVLSGSRLSQLRLDSSSEQDSSTGGSPSPDGPLRPTALRPFRMVELPLTSDSEFFSILTTELSGLAALQTAEKTRLSAQVTELGAVVSKVTEPDRRTASKVDLTKWRRVFELYVDSSIFFSANGDQDRGQQRDAATAQAQLQKFSDELRRQEIAVAFKKKESAVALERFLQLNVEMLQSMRFQEINDLAMKKILKKFDKRTALNIKTTFPTTLQLLPHGLTLLPASTAKAICHQLSTSLLPLVPSLDDYLCPVCFGISWRPIRLRCGHIFCIRCLVVLQRARQDHCPLCRGNVVMQADANNLDPALARFLRRYFPEEVRAKQKENEVAAGVDRYGQAFVGGRCVVM
ncbi:RING-14 protein-like protein [Phyllosticta citribraziliensis]|uniref:RING-14 protein-like protein n=1 Tax=Phyllosticta citribraziliensis TaxID=989973 RepID=A0ABR1L420_9PEZI